MYSWRQMLLCDSLKCQICKWIWYIVSIRNKRHALWLVHSDSLKENTKSEFVLFIKLTLRTNRVFFFKFQCYLRAFLLHAFWMKCYCETYFFIKYINYLHHVFWQLWSFKCTRVMFWDYIDNYIIVNVIMFISNMFPKIILYFILIGEDVHF